MVLVVAKGLSTGRVLSHSLLRMHKTKTIKFLLSFVLYGDAHMSVLMGERGTSPSFTFTSNFVISTPILAWYINEWSFLRFLLFVISFLSALLFPADMDLIGNEEDFIGDREEATRRGGRRFGGEPPSPLSTSLSSLSSSEDPVLPLGMRRSVEIGRRKAVVD